MGANNKDFVELMLKKSKEKDPLPKGQNMNVSKEDLAKAEDLVKKIKEKIK